MKLHKGEVWFVEFFSYSQEYYKGTLYFYILFKFYNNIPKNVNIFENIFNTILSQNILMEKGGYLIFL